MLLHPLATVAIRLLRRDDDSDDEDENCVPVTPGPNDNVPITACNSYYNYDPQFAPAVAVAVIFGVFTAIHVVEGIVLKKRYTWVLIMGALWETLAFTIHSLGAKDQQQIGYATAWQILFLLAPLWVNAFVFMTFARMVRYWHPEGKVAGLRADVIAKWFVLADILSFVVQGTGGIMASPDAGEDVVRIGLNIYLGGMGLQQMFILMFLGLMVVFQRRCAATSLDDGKRSWRPLLFGLYGVLVCITIRIIFRLAEFARGIESDNPLLFHEEYAYALDCFPMMVSFLILAVLHPGRYLVGPESEFPGVSRKEKKALKMQKRTARRNDKEAKKREKRVRKEGRKAERSGSDDNGLLV